MGLTAEGLRERFGGATVGPAYLRNADGLVAVELPVERVREAVQWLRDEAEPRFPQVASLTATDESLPEDSEPDNVALRKGARKRFRLVYHLRAIGVGGQVVRLVAWLDEGEHAPSITDLFPGVEWYEREVYDLFGIGFTDHPDLKRILMPDGYEGHPLRKDFPLRGLSPDRLYRQWDLERRTEEASS